MAEFIPRAAAVRALVGAAAVVATSAITYAETRAGLARLRRDGALTVPNYTSAKREFEQQWPSFMTLDATDALCRTAGELQLHLPPNVLWRRVC